MDILGREQPIVYQIDDVFDPRMAQMVYNAQQNYVNALREDYLQTQKDLKDFRKEYGDFYSPFAKDNENWDRLTNGAIREVMDKYGPDMLRSIEGRAQIQKAINSIPYGELQKLKMGAEAAKQYLINRGNLSTKRKYNKDYEDYTLKQLGIPSFEDYDTLKNGVWTRTSPEEYMTLTELSDPVYSDMKASEKGTKGGYRYRGIDENDLLNVAKEKAQYLKNDPLGGYYYNVLKNNILSKNPNATQEYIDQEFIKDVAHSQAKRIYSEKNADEFALTKYRADQGIREHAANAATDYKYAKRLKKEEDDAQNIFRGADNNGTGSVHYDTKDTKYLKINSSPGADIKEIYDDGGKFKSYNIPKNQMNRLFYTTNSIYGRGQNRGIRFKVPKNVSDFYFEPAGELHAKTDKSGRTRYFISGTIKYQSGVKVDEYGNPITDKNGNTIPNFKVIRPNGNKGVVQMEVFEKDNQYTEKYLEP